MQPTRPRSASVEVDGARLRRLRKLRGLSVSALAEAADISVQYVSFIERNERNPLPDKFVRICNALELATDEERATLLVDEDPEKFRRMCEALGLAIGSGDRAASPARQAGAA